MAKRRDIIIAAIIIGSSIVVFAVFGMVLVSMFDGGGEFGFAGLGNAVGVIEMSGIIDESSGRPVIRDLERWRDNSSIRAIVVHVNSPGGGVAITQEIYDAMQRVRHDGKPVVVAMASVAASGGYYLACAADRVIANPGTITGSIGVIFSFHTFEELLGKVGVGTETIKSGEFKDVGSYSRDMTHKEELMLRSVVMDSYQQFVEVVADGRELTIDEVYPLADGSIYTGLQAYNLGLVDELGGLHEAVALAGELAEIDGEPDVIRPRRRDDFRFFDFMTNIAENIQGSIQNSLSGPQLMYLYR